MSTQPNDPVIEITRSILTEAAQRPWLAALLMRRKPDWLTRLAHLAQRVRDLPRHTRRALRRKLASGLAAAALLLALAGAPMAYAGGVVGDGTSASCDDAALDAALAGGGLVTFNCGTDPLTIVVATKTINADTTIDGGGLIALSGNNANRVIEVSSGAALTLTQTSIISGNVTGNGGGILNNGTLTVITSTISGNTATNGAGGGLYSNGTLTVQDSDIISNTAYVGGGLYSNGTLTVQNSTISGNIGPIGGGIANGGALAVQDSDIISNMAYNGGGIANGGTLTVTNSTLSGNTAYYIGVIYNVGALTVQDSDIISNTARYGGGIANVGTLAVQDSDIISNTANFSGGGIVNVGTLTVTNSTLSGNTASVNGGGIYSSGEDASATVQDSDILSNTASATGGGIDNSGTLTVTNSTLSGNTAQWGGGIYSNGTLTVQGSDIISNTADSVGGGIYSSGEDASATVQDSDILSNTASVNGGGIDNVDGMLTVQDSTLSGNMATNFGGGISNSGPLTVTNSTISGNTASGNGGGGISNSGPLIVTNSTLSGNTAATGGGGIYSNGTNGTVTVTNSTLSGNTASGGGGIYNFSTVTVTNSTLSGNTAAHGGGIDNYGGTVYAQNSIVAGQASGADCTIYDGGTITSGGYNIESATSCGFNQPGDQQNVDDASLDLKALANNGGPTLTRALGMNSVAIDAGNSAACLPTDQRGQARDDLACDVGAFELKFADSDTVVRPVSSTAVTTFGPALMGLMRDAGSDDPGVITVTKSISWTTPPTNGVLAKWAITPTNTTGTFSLTMQLCYTAAELNGQTEGDLRFWRSSGGLTQVGGAPTPSAVNGLSCATLSGIDALSTWTLATASPTAVVLRDLTATANPSPGVIGAVGAALASLAAFGALLIGRRRLTVR